MNWKKISLYIVCAFAVSWAVALLMVLADIKLNSMLGITLLAGLYMTGPALAAFLIQKFIYKSGFEQYGWSFDKKAIKWILATPLLFLALTLLTFAIIACLGNTNLIPEFGRVDFSQANFNMQLKEFVGDKVDIEKINLPDIPPILLFIAMLAQGIIGGSTLNLPFMFGEEFGWRGLMLAETKPLGFLKANLFIGLIWGIWHLPVILMGHNYPNHPYLGIVMMCLFTTAISPLFAYVRIKTKSILGPCMLHGMINGTGAMYILYLANRNELYSSVAGWAGIIAGIILTICIFLFDKKFVAQYPNAD